jgi:hypothetical protein
MSAQDFYVPCATCDGRGWVAEHEDACYEDGCCSCSGVQVVCPDCADSPEAGYVLASSASAAGAAP